MKEKMLVALDEERKREVIQSKCKTLGIMLTCCSQMDEGLFSDVQRSVNALFDNIIDKMDELRKASDNTESEV